MKQQSQAVLPLCCYGKVLDFMIKKTRFTKKTLDYKILISLIKEFNVS